MNGGDVKQKAIVCSDTNERPKTYQKYLRTQHWQLKRASKIIEQKGICEMCKKKLSYKSSNLHIHHITYKNIGNEPLSDLMCLCADCHKQLHREMKRSKNDKVSKPKKTHGGLKTLIFQNFAKLNNDERAEVLESLNRKYGNYGVHQVRSENA